MSDALLRMARDFIQKGLPADEFTEEYIRAWHQEQDEGILKNDPPKLGEVMSTIFCLADMYNPSAVRVIGEFGEDVLRQRISETLGAAGQL